MGTVRAPCVFPYQPRSLAPPHWTQKELIGFASDQNRAYLKQEVLRRFNGAISETNLWQPMFENGDWYLNKYIDFTYAAPTDEKAMEVVQMLNERVLRRIGQLYAAERAVTSQWLQEQHQPSFMNSAYPRVERISNLDGYDFPMTL